MQAFLPPHLDDELWYSVLARIRASLGSVSSRRFARLFDVSLVAPLLTRNLARHAAEFPDVWGLTPERLLAAHSILPYFVSTVPPSTRKACSELLIGTGSGGALPVGYKSAWNPISPGRPTLRFCSSCVEEDIRKVGAAAWKRSHNLPEVYVCHRHGEALRISDVARNCTDIATCPGSAAETVVSPFGAEVTSWLARESAWMLEAPYASLSRRELKGALRVALYGRGWPRGVIKVRREVTDAFIAAYGLENLRRLRFRVLDGIPQLGRELSPSCGIHPARLIVLLHFMGLRAGSVLGQATGNPAHEAALQPVDSPPGPLRIARLRSLLLEHPPSARDIRRIRVASSTLRRFDTEWYEMNVTPHAARQCGRPRMLDDRATSDAIRREALRIPRVTPWKRVTRTALLACMGVTAFKTEREARYPRITAALKACTETLETYQLRRLSWISDGHVAQGVPVTWSEFSEKAYGYPRAMVEAAYHDFLARIGCHFELQHQRTKGRSRDG